jgi:hypothetical protein
MKPAWIVLLVLHFGCPGVHAAPRLWFSKEDVPRLRAIVAQGKEAAVWERIRQRAEEYCDPEARAYADPEKVDQRPSPEWRVQILGHHFGRRLTDWMETLGFAYQISGDERFSKHGALLLEAAARKLPVTDPDIAKGFAGARGDIMRGLAVGYDWLGEAMTPEQKAVWSETGAGYVRNILAEVSRERVWWRPHHNFMGVAVGAAGMLSLTLREFYPDEAPEWTAFCAEQVDLWLRSGFDARGAYVEGTTYGMYGLGNALRFADALRRSGGADLLEHPHLRGVPRFYAMSLLPGEPVFDARNDANYSGFNDPTLRLLARDHGNGLAAWLWERTGSGLSPFAVLWASDVAPVEPAAAGEPLSQHFEGRGLCIWRTGWEAGDVMFSIEAGPYYPVTHNQADEGHFTLYGLGRRWSIDSGYGNTGLPGGRDQTVAHSCVLVDGEGMARSGAGRGTSGRLAEYYDDADYGYALADATEAYSRNDRGEPGAMVERARRHALFLRPSHGAPAYAAVMDDVRKDHRQREYTWMMHAPGDVHVRTDDAGAVLMPEIALPVTLIETPDDAPGRGAAVWTFEVAEAGEYTVWGRVRVAGDVAPRSDSFFVELDDNARIDWHIPARRDWTWGKVGAGVPSRPARWRLAPGSHTLRILTREPGAQLERIVITADAEANPPFVGQHASVTLRAEDAAVTAPMQVVRHEGCPDAPRMRLRLTAAAPLRHEVQRYDDHLRLDFRATAVRPEFVALLFPLPADLEDPIVDVQFDGDDLCLEVRWPGRTDRIIWPAEEPRRPVVAVEVP